MSHAETPYADRIKVLDLPAKVRLLTGASGFSLHAEDRIGLAEMHVSDGPTGVRGLTFIGGREVTLFPNATLLASTWDPEVLAEVGGLLAEEARAQSISLVLGPTINLHRSPLGGRLFEAFSEDPYLTGVLAAAYVNGLQGRGIGACPKHLVGNESETLRNTMNSVIDEQTLREVYLLPFELAVTRSHPWSIMAAYNDVNGITATENTKINTGVLRHEWDWDGVLVSDWFATKSAAPAANGGLDLVMPGPIGPWGDALVEAVGRGEVDEQTIDEHLSRLLLLAERAGRLDGPAIDDDTVPGPDSPVRREQMTRIAARGMTVLTNRDAALPLRSEQRVALIGRHAIETIGMGGGSAQVNTPHQVSVADAMADRFAGLTVTDGVEFRGRQPRARTEFLTDPETGNPGLRISTHTADGTIIDSAHSLVAATTVEPGGEVDHVSFTAIVRGDGPVLLGGLGVGDFTVKAGGTTHTLSVAASGDGFAEDLLAPPGEAVEVDLGDDRTVSLTARAGFDGVGNLAFLGLIARPTPRDAEAAIVEARSAAAAADVAVVVVGLSEEQETESVDKTTLTLPGRQDDLVRAVAEVATRTVVVINAATPVLMPWRDHVDAIVVAGLPGQEAGAAITAALLGKVEPAGRLVTTWPMADVESAAWTVTPDADGSVVYAEGTFVGHRAHHAELQPAPAFWFGHGLGYSTWSYENAHLVEADSPTVRLDLTNTGGRDSTEIVQLYLDPTDSSQPVRLVGWTVVHLAAGEARNVTVAADPIMLRTWQDGWVPLPLEGRLLVARGLGDLRASLVLGHQTPPR
ncbi:MAG: glycoside hydrolase family 3 C-terminal domain-containing protein [Propionibacteriales bacterium]|nr:glycoside hydrolase family 3 C-terminal domain-containing protein [Propionibacteriales bacterium]